MLKLQAGRINDRADAAMVLREDRDEIDFSESIGRSYATDSATMIALSGGKPFQASRCRLWAEGVPGRAGACPHLQAAQLQGKRGQAEQAPPTLQLKTTLPRHHPQKRGQNCWLR